MQGISRMWEARSSWKERFAMPLNGCRNSTSDSNQKLVAKRCAVRLADRCDSNAPSIVSVASIVFMILIIKMVSGFDAIEDNTQDILLPE